MSSSKQPKPNALRSRISAPPAANSARTAKRVPSAGGVKKAGAKPSPKPAANPLKNNALFQAISGVPRTSPTTSAQPLQPKPGQELRDRIAGKTPAKVNTPPQVKPQPAAKPPHPLAARFGQTPLPKTKLSKTPSSSSTPDYNSSSNNSRRPSREPTSSFGSWKDHRNSGGYDKQGKEDMFGTYDKYGRSQEKYDSRDRDRYERARIDRRDHDSRDSGSDRYDSRSSGNGSYSNGSRDRRSQSSEHGSRSQAQNYQESRERYADDRVRYNALAQKQASATESGSAAPTGYTETPAVSHGVPPAPRASDGTTTSANGTPTYSIKHLAMPPIVQISNLDRGTTRDDLYKFFVELGAIRDCRILTLGNQGAMGEITFEDPENARIAFAKFNGALADGRRLVVNIVKYNSIAEVKPVEVNNNVHQWPGAVPLRSDTYLRK